MGKVLLVAPSESGNALRSPPSKVGGRKPTSWCTFEHIPQRAARGILHDDVEMCGTLVCAEHPRRPCHVGFRFECEQEKVAFRLRAGLLAVLERECLGDAFANVHTPIEAAADKLDDSKLCVSERSKRLEIIVGEAQALNLGGFLCGMWVNGTMRQA